MNRLSIFEIARGGTGIRTERLEFNKGLNVIVGGPNTGKTKWMQMLDYCFGYEKRPEDSFGEDLARKYDFIMARIEIAEQEYIIERRWKELGNFSKVYFNGRLITAQDFCVELMALLEIPILHYPQGDPLGIRKWPELNWRSLLRHVYRRQNSWSDLADKQPTSEQHACILQFLGMAQNMFSDEYGKLVDKQKQVFELQATKDQFLNTLQQITREILHEDEKGLTISRQVIDGAIRRVESAIKKSNDDRKQALELLAYNANNVVKHAEKKGALAFDAIAKDLGNLREELSNLRQRQASAEKRRSEIVLYRDSITAELGRLERARFAGTTFANLKVTHCPACDQPISRHDTDPTHCYVCGQEKSEILQDSEKRIEFELEHLRAELEESKELLIALEDEIATHKASEQTFITRIDTLEATLLPFQQAASAIIPPEIALLDIQAGSLQERLQHLLRVRRAFDRREQVSEQIASLEDEISKLEQTVNYQNQSVRFERGATWLSDGMDRYLRDIDTLRPGSWSQGRVRWQLRERGFKIAVGSSLWASKLGGTLTLYFLLAYSYSLLRLTEKPGCHFPGLLILDFPPELPDGTSVADKENFLLEPFLSLLPTDEAPFIQVIAVGSAFVGLEGVNRIELHKVWQ